MLRFSPMLGVIVALLGDDVVAGDVTDLIDAFRLATPQARVDVVGGEVRQIHGTAMSRGGTVEQSAASFLNAHVGMFGVTADMLRPANPVTVMSGRFTVRAYRQFVGEVPVHDRWLRLLIRNTADHPLVLVNSSLRAIEAGLGRAQTTAHQAIGVVRDANPRLGNFGVPALVYYPEAGGEVSLAWHFFADNGAHRGFENWQFFVDAIGGGVIERLPGIYHVGVGGMADGLQTPDPLPDQPNNAPELFPVFGARIRSDTGGTAYTDAAGLYMLDDADADPMSIELDLDGQWCTVINDAGETLTASEPIGDTGTADFTLNVSGDEFVTSQLNAIAAVTRVHDFLKEIDSATAFLDVPIATTVNLDDTCNAFYSLDDESINFFRAGDGCPNTAYASVIYHEYAHFLVDLAPGGPDTTRYHEAMADALSFLLLGDPCVAPDLDGQDAGCLRNPATAGLRYPCFAPPHFCSQILSGAIWDMRANLIDSLGSDEGLAITHDLYVAQILMGLHTVAPGVTLDFLTLDDDDGDLSNGTPNYHAINNAFSDHGMAGPTVLFNDGDFNGDGDVDLFDYTEFHRCMTGPGGSVEGDCEAGDFDGDGDIDLIDYRRVSNRFSGDCGVLLTLGPEDVTACFGDLVTFTVAGTGQIEEYVWTRNDNIIPGANNQILVIDPVSADTLGRYRGTVVGGCAAVTSDEVRLSLPDHPVVVVLPVAVETCVGDVASFSVTAVGWEELFYQWRLDGEDIAGATDATYTIDPVTHDDIGSYTCVVSDRCGQSDSTEDVPVTLSFIPPTIVTQPQLFLTCQGLPAEFMIEVDGPQPVTYQWRFEDVDIPGATEATYALGSVTDDDLGLYTCVVSDGCGSSVLSQAARLKYGEVVINAQPIGGTFCEGDSIFLFVVTADGFTFQWFKDDVPIPGATSLFLAIANATPQDAGTYHLFATSLCNEVTSEDAVVNVVPCGSAP